MNLDKYYNEGLTKAYLEVKELNRQNRRVAEHLFDKVFTSNKNQNDLAEFGYSYIEALLNPVVYVDGYRAYLLDADAQIMFLKSQLEEPLVDNSNDSESRNKELQLYKAAIGIGSENEFLLSINEIATQYGVEIIDKRLFYTIITNLIIEHKPVAKDMNVVKNRVSNNLRNQIDFLYGKFKFVQNSDLHDELEGNSFRTFKELFMKAGEEGIQLWESFSDQDKKEMKAIEDRHVYPLEYALELLSLPMVNDKIISENDLDRFNTITLEQTVNSEFDLARDAFIYDIFNKYCPDIYPLEGIEDILESKGQSNSKTNRHRYKRTRIKKFLNKSVSSSLNFRAT